MRPIFQVLNIFLLQRSTDIVEMLETSEVMVIQEIQLMLNSAHMTEIMTNQQETVQVCAALLCYNGSDFLYVSVFDITCIEIEIQHDIWFSYSNCINFFVAEIIKD